MRYITHLRSLWVYQEDFRTFLAAPALTLAEIDEQRAGGENGDLAVHRLVYFWTQQFRREW